MLTPRPTRSQPDSNDGKMIGLRLPEKVYARSDSIVLFNQLGLKIEMDRVSNEDYFAWLDKAIKTVHSIIPGAQIVEKPQARVTPPLNVAVYYDTGDYKILPTGALLRTSCNRVTHAFCAFKMARDMYNVRSDHRYVFSGEDKHTIQVSPTSHAAVAIVKRLLARKDIEHPGTFLERYLHIRPEEVEPSICLEDYRYTFFVWLDGKDALRCSMDRFEVTNLRLPEYERVKKPISEVELSIYPRIDPELAKSERVVHLIEGLAASLCDTFGVSVTKDIKYQRAANVLGLGPQ